MITKELKDWSIDDAWLEVTGNILLYEKLNLAQFVADKLNRPAAANGASQAEAASHPKDSEGKDQGWGGGQQSGESLLAFKSYDQGREKFQGETLDLFWADEESCSPRRLRYWIPRPVRQNRTQPRKD